MATFIVNARDKADALELRLATREDHLAWAGSHIDKILMAGPVFREDGETMAGSTFVLEMESLEAVRAWAAEDPYAKAGLFAQVEIAPFRWAIGEGRGS